MTQKPKLLILGHARHGKDTVAEILRDERGYSFESSSMYAAKRLIMPFFEAQGVPYANLEDCYADRVNHRALWFDLITEFNTPYKSRLAKESSNITTCMLACVMLMSSQIAKLCSISSCGSMLQVGDFPRNLRIASISITRKR